LLLHALLVVLAARRPPSHGVSVVSSPPSELEVEVVAAAPEETTAAAPTPAEPSAAAAPAAPRAGSAAHVATLEAASPEEASTDSAAEAAAGEGAAPPSASPSAAGPHLSLAQLGVEGNNPFIDRADPAALRAARTQRVKERLDRALAQGIIAQESAAGRGAAGPVLRTLEGLVYASTLPLNSQATFSLVIDSSGKIVSSSLGAAEGDRAAWLRVAHETARALATRTLSVPKGKSVRLTLAVTSRLQLPSGADPGFEVDVFGLPIKKGDGPRSTRLDILNPTKGAPLSLAGDPADVGSRPRRVVNAHVVSEELL
jgi:hypothetical protein